MVKNYMLFVIFLMQGYFLQAQSIAPILNARARSGVKYSANAGNQLSKGISIGGNEGMKPLSPNKVSSTGPSQYEAFNQRKQIDSLPSPNLAEGPKFMLKTESISSNMSVATAGPSGRGKALVTDPNVGKPLVVFGSPNVASLSSNISESVDLYTGKLNVTIPLSTVQTGSIVVPIGLSYHGGNGIKVNELSGPSGLGWDLSAGGNISRVMHDLPDEANLSLTQVNNPYYSGLDTPGLFAPKIFSVGNIGYLNLNSLASKDLNNYPNLGDGGKADIIDYTNYPPRSLPPGCVTGTTGCPLPFIKFDTQPDEFYYNFGKYSGKFVFDQSGNILTVPKQNFKIVPLIQKVNNQDKLVQFTVTTEEGTVYTFGDTNLASVEESYLNHADTVLSTYEYRGNLTGVIYNGTKVFRYSRTPYIHTYSIGVCQNVYYDDFSRGKNGSALNVDYFPVTWFLTKIVSPVGDFVNFNYEPSASDPIWYKQNGSLSSSFPNLSELQFSSDSNDWSFITQTPPTVENCKSYGTLPIFQNLNYASDWVSLKGKRLKSIESSNQVIKFDALTVRSDMPGDKRLDKISIMDKSNTLIKYFTFKYTEKYNSEPVFPNLVLYPGVDGSGRSFVASFSLEPEERDKYRLFLDAITEYAPDNSSKPPILLKYFDTNFPPRFSVNQDQWGYYKMNLNGHSILNVNYIGAGGDAVPRSGFPIFSWGVVDGAKPVPGWGTQNYVVSDNPNSLTSGLLKQIVYPTGGYKEFAYEQNKVGNDLSGGVRLISEKDFTSAGNQAFTTTNYAYTNGVSINPMVTSYVLPEYIGDSRVFTTDQVFRGLETTKGALVGYGKVEVSQSGNGKKVNNFYTASDYPDDLTPITRLYNNTITTNTYPFPPNVSNDHKRGLLYLETTLDNSGNITTEKKYDYIFNPPGFEVKKSPGVMGAQLAYGGVSPIYIGVLWNNWYLSAPYSYQSNWSYLKSVNEKVYNGQNYLTNTTNYFYDNLVHLQPTRTEQDGSDGKVITSLITYPDDYPSGTGFIDDMKSKHLTAYPIEQVNYVDDSGIKSIVGGAITEYRPGGKGLKSQEYQLETNALLSLSTFKFSNRTIGVLPISGSQTAYVPDGRYIPTLSYKNYDTNGNLLSSLRTNGVQVSYVWGYNKQYPIAQAFDAEDTDIAFASFEKQEGGGGWEAFNEEFIQTDPVISKNGVYGLSGGQPLKKSTLISNKVYEIKYKYRANASVVVLAGSQPVTPITSPLANGWIEAKCSISNVTSVSISGTAQIDDLYIYPVNSLFTTYSYTPLVGITSSTDSKGQTTYYEYDVFQRLKNTIDQNGNIIKSNVYHYKP